MKPKDDNLYEAFGKKSGKINPLLAAMYELEEPEEIDRFISDFASTFSNGGSNRHKYNQDRLNKNGSGKIKNLVYSYLSNIFYPYQDEIRSTPEGEMRAENWERSLKKLIN